MNQDIRVLLETWTPGCVWRAEVKLRTLPLAAINAELVALAQDENPNVRAGGLQLAGEVAPEVADDLAVALITDPVGFVRWAACERVLLRRCYRAADRLAQLLIREENELVRNMAAGALGSVGDRKHLPALQMALAVETGVDHEGSPIRNRIILAIETIETRCPLTAE